MEGSTDHAAAGVDMAKLRQATPVKSKCKPTILGGLNINAALWVPYSWGAPWGLIDVIKSLGN